MKLFLTFDYELPLGGLCTSYDKALFDPTYRVLDIADKYGVKVTLFIDILCAEKFKEWDYSAFYSPYENQLQQAITNGHDVQLHIHPHWLTTKYDGKDYRPSQDFSLADFRNDTKFGGIPGIVKLSIDSIQSTVMQFDENYKCVAFRAGGYNLYPDTELILNSLYDNGIRYDSSMAKGYCFKSGISEVDFRKLPDFPNWIINPKNYHSALSDKRGILEIPIATISKTPFEMPTGFKMKKYAYRAADNRGKVIHCEDKIDFISKLKMLFSARMLTFDNYTLSDEYLLRIVKYNRDKYCCDTTDEIMLCVISHPKSMGDYSFRLMEHFITSVQRLFPDTEFSTYAQLNQLNRQQ
jgi:hypothetical protein